MSSISQRLVRRTARSIFSFISLSSPPRASTPRLFSRGSLQLALCSNASAIQMPKLILGGDEKNYMFPAIFASILGLGAVKVAYAEAEDNKSTNSPIPSDLPLGSSSLEDIARNERRRIEDLLKSKKMLYGSYPKFTVAVKGQKVTFKFQVPPACEISQLIANLVSNLGVKTEERSGGSDMLLRGWDSAVSWQLTLSYPGKQKEEANLNNNENATIDEGDLCVLIFNSLISRDKAEIEFMKTGSLSPKELEAFVSLLQLAAGKLGQEKLSERRPRESNGGKPTPEKTISRLESMGVRIYGLNEPHLNSSNHEISWENIAGYDKQKREIEDTVVLALHSPEVYDDIARGTRQKFESNRPRAMLFEGPPGTGKTSCARVIANQAGVPLLYVPLEIIMSKYYGESERLLGQVFSLADELSNGAIIFLDEVDSFAVARDSEMHEATRRVLSVLLRQIDGFEQDKKVVVIAATNRKQDLDPALVSRFDSIITFDLPDHQTGQEIASQYAKHLKEAELVELATATEGMSGRDIRDVCQHAERLWASKIIRGLANKDEQGFLPPLQEYLESAANRRNSLLSIAEQKEAESTKPSSRKKFRLDLS